MKHDRSESDALQIFMLNFGDFRERYEEPTQERDVEDNRRHLHNRVSALMTPKQHVLGKTHDFPESTARQGIVEPTF